MALMKEAMTREDWERSEKGLPRIKPKVVPRPEPEKPEIENEIKFKDIKVDNFIDLIEAKRNVVKNKEGVRFVGFDVTMTFEQKGSFGHPKKDEDGKIVGPKVLTGWMNEGDFLLLNRTFREKIRPQVIRW